jgi:CheY-like chemotaxis protein
VRGDATRIRQVLVNLGANAVKFTGAGEVTIRVTAGQGIGGQRELRFEVRDTGPGIAEETIKNLFQPFVQADPSTTRKHGGTGLGLSISRSLVEKMGGQIACESTPGHGSRFHFEIPFEAPSAPPASQPPPSWGAGAKILVAHERATVREMISAMLRRADLQVERASDPELVLNRIERGEPGVEGYAAVLVSGSAGPRRIAELNRCARGNGPITPPILVLSAAGLRGDSRRYQEMGLAGFLTLPVRHDVLLAHLESCLTGEPLNLVGERREANELSPPASPVADRGPGTVLVIDDNPVNQRVIERMLEQLGRSVRLCSTGEEGLRCWRDVRPALVLCDVQMPDMDGLEVARALRAEENRGEHTPILALTAGTGGNDRENCLEAGMDDYLTKPVSFDTLAAMLERWWPSTREPAESVADGTASRP